MVNFLSWIPVTRTVLLFWIYLFLLTQVFVLNSDHVVVSVCINFTLNSKRDGPFHHIVYDCSRPNCDGLRDHLKDVPCEDIFKLSASVASEFCEWFQVVIDVYIPICKTQAKTHSSPLSSAACAALIVH